MKETSGAIGLISGATTIWLSWIEGKGIDRLSTFAGTKWTRANPHQS